MEQKTQPRKIQDMTEEEWESLTPDGLVDLLIQVRSNMTPQEIAEEEELFKSLVRQPESFDTK